MQLALGLVIVTGVGRNSVWGKDVFAEIGVSASLDISVSVFLLN
ncbi:hypothetical protein VCRA2113O120_190089 [Vibrio crassostreae]|nr:hypothetical protein VCRA2113O120_190089 [Vibrio crassostreae]CAK3196249.1 hypothetical protein VCRA2123E130_170017 [Vibrio crassostreae]